MHVGQDREITSSLLGHIYSSSQIFIVRLEISLLSGQFRTSLWGPGSFPGVSIPTPVSADWGTPFVYFHITFPLSDFPQSATFPDSLSLPTSLAVSKSTASPINLSAQEATSGNKYRNALLPASVTTAATDGAWSHLGIVERQPPLQKNYSSQKTLRQRRVAHLSFCALLNSSSDSNSHCALR